VFNGLAKKKNWDLAKHNHLAKKILHSCVPFFSVFVKFQRFGDTVPKVHVFLVSQAFVCFASEPKLEKQT